MILKTIPGQYLTYKQLLWFTFVKNHQLNVYHDKQRISTLLDMLALKLSFYELENQVFCSYV